MTYIYTGQVACSARYYMAQMISLVVVDLTMQMQMEGGKHYVIKTNDQAP